MSQKIPPKIPNEPKNSTQNLEKSRKTLENLNNARLVVIIKLFRSDSRCTADEQHDLFRSDFLDLNVVSII